MQKKERQQKKTQLHMQNMSGHMQNLTKEREKNEKNKIKSKVRSMEQCAVQHLMNPQ